MNLRLLRPMASFVGLLWVPADGLPAAVEALKARGFRYEPPAAN